MTQLRRLHWGCGDVRPPGWINADTGEGPGLDINSDIILDGLPLDENSIDYLVSQHALQRLEVYYLWTALDELYRVLKPGGIIRLGATDLDSLIDAYKNGRQEDLWCWEWATISGNVITQLINYNATRTPLTYEFTEELLQKAGFTAVRRVGYRETAGPYPEIVELDSRPEESFYVEAMKPVTAPKAAPIAPGHASQIHLSWTEDPSTSFTVLWHTPLGNKPAFVDYREQGVETWLSLPAQTKPSPSAGKLHQATVGGLSPNTAYEYRVSGDQGALPEVSEIYAMRTAAAKGPADFCFAFLCDMGIAGRSDGNSTGTRQVIDELFSDRPLFILGGGDYAYANRDDRYHTVGEAIDAWFSQMQPLLARYPFMAQYGNHEVHIRERFRDWSPRFAHPEGFDQGKNYSFDVGDVHFAALFVPGPPPATEQILWLDNDLSQARKHGMRWLIVYQHEPIYAHGHSHPARPEVRRMLAPVFEKHRVDLHLSGHDQNYERSYPLVGAPDHPTPMSTSQSDYQASEGVIYAKISPAGKMSEKRNDFSRFTTAQQPYIAKRDDTAHHYALITVRATGALRVDVYSVIGDGTPKSLLDSFQIVRPP
jgi:acid phosphatase type 7